MFPSNHSFARQPAVEKDESANETIYDQIHHRVCSMLTQERIANLREMLRSIMTHEDLTSFCTDRSKLSLISYDPPSGGHGPARAFRCNVLTVRLLVFVETDGNDTELQRVQITADIQDGNQSGTRPLVDWTNAVETEAPEVNRY